MCTLNQINQMCDSIMLSKATNTQEQTTYTVKDYDL